MVFSDPETLRALQNSTIIGLGTAFIVMILSTVAAWGLTQYQFKYKSAFLAFFLLPIVIPNVVLGISGLIFLVQVGIPRELLSAIPFTTIYAASFGLLVNLATLNLFRRSLLSAAANLGARPFAQFKEIVMPLISPGMLTAFLVGFILGFTNFDLSAYTIGANPTVPSMTWSSLRHGFRPHIFGASTFAVLLTIVITFMIFITLKVIYERTRQLRLIGKK
jgi:ABC-type spermidine/putrescine transport system permease subunit II